MNLPPACGGRRRFGAAPGVRSNFAVTSAFMPGEAGFSASAERARSDPEPLGYDRGTRTCGARATLSWRGSRQRGIDPVSPHCSISYSAEINL